MGDYAHRAGFGHSLRLRELSAPAPWKKQFTALVILCLCLCAFFPSVARGEYTTGTIQLTVQSGSVAFPNANIGALTVSGGGWGGGAATVNIGATYTAFISDNIAVLITGDKTSTPPVSYATAVAVTYEGDGWYRFVFTGYFSGTAYAYFQPSTWNAAGTIDTTAVLVGSPTFNYSGTSNKSFLDTSGASDPAASIRWFSSITGGAGGGDGNMVPVVDALNQGLQPNPAHIANINQDAKDAPDDPMESDVFDRISTKIRAAFGLSSTHDLPTAVAFTTSPDGEAWLSGAYTLPMGVLSETDAVFNYGTVHADFSSSGVAQIAAEADILTTLDSWRERIRMVLLFALYLLFICAVYRALTQF